jgi:SAM-dependent methyltransferase
VPLSGEQLTPTGGRARVQANLQALRVLRELERDQRPAGPDELRVVAAWSGWGAVPAVFDEQRSEWAGAREQLRELLDEDAYAAARRTTINAHYTAPAIAAAIWQSVHELGFDGGRVLEPGCGAGVFLGLAPESAELTGIELDPSTAAIARALYPHADVRAESFAATRLPDGYFDLVVGNVPFADVRLHDPRHNHGRHSLHNHFVIKSLALTRPGGLVAVLSSHYTLDAANPGARREMSELADLVGAVRLPTGAHRRAAGTDALTDLLIFRRREPGAPAAAATAGWESTRTVEIDGQPVRINSYLAERPERVLGELAVGQGMYSAQTLHVHPRGDLAAVPGQLRDALSQLVSEARAAALTFTPRRDVSRGPGASGEVSREAADYVEVVRNFSRVVFADFYWYFSTTVTRGPRIGPRKEAGDCLLRQRIEKRQSLLSRRWLEGCKSCLDSALSHTRRGCGRRRRSAAGLREPIHIGSKTRNCGISIGPC